jgi:Protein kinase domain
MQANNGMPPERDERLILLFEAARVRRAEARVAFLDEACAGDETLRRELEELLAADQKSRGLFETPPAAFTAATIGTQIGSYRIEAKLGEGGMGTVFRAHDTKLNRPVAIKVLSDLLADAAARRRFQREAQMASALNHPHILTVYDAGEWKGRLLGRVCGTTRHAGRQGEVTPLSRPDCLSDPHAQHRNRTPVDPLDRKGDIFSLLPGGDHI